MWLMIFFMVVFLVLDKLKIMKVNTLFMSVLYIMSIPLLICGYISAVVSALMKIAEKATVLRIVNLGASLLIALPAVIMLVVVLYKICRNPIDYERWDGRDDYETACIKRQRTLQWVAYPLTWLCIFAAVGVGVYYLLIVAGMSLVMMHPFFWVMCVFTLGLALPVYGIFVLAVTSPLLIVLALCSCAAFIFMCITAALTATMLWRMRSRLRWPKWKYVVKTISMFIPIWSLLTLIELSQRAREKV